MAKVRRRVRWAAAGFLLGLVGAACGIIGTRLTPGFPVACSVTRQECTREELSAGLVICTEYSPILNFIATACTVEGDSSHAQTCQRSFCGQPADTNYGYLNCSATNTTLGAGPSLGICEPHTDPRRALVTYTQRSRTCTEAEDDTCGDSLDLAVTTRTECVDVSVDPAVETLQPPNVNRDRSVTISSFQLNHSTCPSTDIVVGLTTYGLAPGSSLGTATGPGVSTPITVRNGWAVFQPLVCDPDAGGGNCPRLRRLHAELADVQIAGAQLRSVTVDSIGTTDIRANGTIPSGGLRLAVKGRVNGADSIVVVQNPSPLQAVVGQQTFSIQGSFSAGGTDANGRVVAVSIAANMQGSLAPPQTVACAGMTPLQRLFGFEDTFAWTSSAAQLSLVTSNIRQGCGALGVNGSGYLPITSARFSTAGMGANTALSVDLFIPGGQPNPSWLGALQLYLSCPSGNVFNHFIGQVELTGRPTNQYSTLRFPLSSQTRAVLGSGFTDCSVGVALNVNQTNRTWVLDNLRFTP